MQPINHPLVEGREFAEEEPSSPVDSSSSFFKVSCLACRHRKVKCSGGVTCQRCAKLKQECVYKLHKRGRFSERQKIQQLEETIQKLKLELSEARAVHKSEPVPTSHPSTSKSSSPTRPSTYISQGKNTYQSPKMEEIRKGLLSDQSDTGSSLQEQDPLSSTARRETRPFPRDGPTTHPEELDANADKSISLARLESRRHVFEPFGIENRFVASAFRASQSLPLPRESVSNKLKSLRPFQYFSRIFSLQPHFLIHSTNRYAQSDLRVILSKHAHHIDWERMNFHLQDYCFFLPFLELFPVGEMQIDGEELYLATRLYLAALRAGLLGLQVDLLVYLRVQILSCIRRGPVNVGEVAVMVILALYSPLLLGDTAEELQLGAFDLLTAASTASRRLGLDETPAMMQRWEHAPHLVPPDLIRKCSLWITIAHVSTFNSMGSNIYQPLLLECPLEDIKYVESFCKRLLKTTSTLPLSGQVSLLLLVTYRHRCLMQIRLVIVTQIAELEAMHVFPASQAEAKIVTGLPKALALAKSLLNELKDLQKNLSLPVRTCNMAFDYIEVEIEQFHMLCMTSISEACLLRVDAYYGRSLDMITLVKRMVEEGVDRKFAISIVGVAKNDMARNLVTLFSNFSSQWCKQGHWSVTNQFVTESGFKGTANTLILPPASTCALMLLSLKTMADYVVGFSYFENYPKNCLDDCQAGATVSLCRSVAEALRRCANYQTYEVLKAQGHRDLFQTTAEIAFRTSNAIHEWAATIKGIRNAPKLNIDSLSLITSVGSSSGTTSDSTSSNKTSHSASNTEEPIKPEDEDFRKILDDILSTPILYS